MNTIRLTRVDNETAAGLPPAEHNRTYIPEVSLETLNLSNNQFECFPWVAINDMRELREINLGRNRISQIFDAQEMQEMKRIINDETSSQSVRKQPFERFINLTILDMSSNLLRAFPIEVIVLKLEELNLMNNLIESIPASFYSASVISRSLKRLMLS